jgi:hypothetical protein
MDRTTKILLAVLAAGIWANAAVPLVQVHAAAAPLTQKAPAQNAGFENRVQNSLESIQNSLESIDVIARGNCLNRKIC